MQNASYILSTALLIGGSIPGHSSFVGLHGESNSGTSHLLAIDSANHMAGMKWSEIPTMLPKIGLNHPKVQKKKPLNYGVLKTQPTVRFGLAPPKQSQNVTLLSYPMNFGSDAPKGAIQ